MLTLDKIYSWNWIKIKDKTCWFVIALSGNSTRVYQIPAISRKEAERILIVLNGKD